MATRRPRNPVAHALRSGDGPYRKRVVLMKKRYDRKEKHREDLTSSNHSPYKGFTSDVTET